MSENETIVVIEIENDDRSAWVAEARLFGITVRDTISTNDLREAVLDAARVSLLPCESYPTECRRSHEHVARGEV